MLICPHSRLLRAKPHGFESMKAFPDVLVLADFEVYSLALKSMRVSLQSPESEA